MNEHDGARRVAVAAHHFNWWPSVVTVVDEGWQRRGTFVHAGWIERTHWVSSDRLLVAGYSQERDGGMVAILDAAALDGQGPVPETDPLYCPDCGSGRPLRYVVMPRSEVNRISASRFNRAIVQAVGERVVIRTVEVPSEREGQAADALYEFTPDLELTRASFSDRYWEMHRALELEGKLDHTREACPDRNGPGELEIWQPDTGWRRLAIE